MKAGDHLLVIIVIALIGVFASVYYDLGAFSYVISGIVLFLFSLAYLINMYISYRYTEEEVKMKKQEVKNYWEVVRGHPDILKNSTVGFK